MSKFQRITDEDLVNLFTYHSPNEEQIDKYQSIRDAALALATIIRDNTPTSSMQTLAVRKVQEAVMWANGSIATHKDK